MRILLQKKNVLLCIIVLLPIIFVTKQFLSKPVYNLTGKLTVGKLFERPLLPSNQILQDLRSYKNNKNYKNILHDVYLDESQELFFDGSNKRYQIHSKLVIDFRGNDKDVLLEKMNKLLKKIKIKHDKFFEESINLYRTLPISVQMSESTTALKSFKAQFALGFALGTGLLCLLFAEAIFRAFSLSLVSDANCISIRWFQN